MEEVMKRGEIAERKMVLDGNRSSDSRVRTRRSAPTRNLSSERWNGRTRRSSVGEARDGRKSPGTQIPNRTSGSTGGRGSSPLHGICWVHVHR